MKSEKNISRQSAECQIIYIQFFFLFKNLIQSIFNKQNSLVFTVSQGRP